MPNQKKSKTPTAQAQVSQQTTKSKLGVTQRTISKQMLLALAQHTATLRQRLAFLQDQRKEKLELHIDKLNQAQCKAEKAVSSSGLGTTVVMTSASNTASYSKTMHTSTTLIVRHLSHSKTQAPTTAPTTTASTQDHNVKRRLFITIIKKRAPADIQDHNFASPAGEAGAQRRVRGFQK